MEEFLGDDVLTFLDANGEVIDFKVLVRPNYKNREYAIMQPIVKPDDMEENAVFVAELIVEDGEENYQIITDDDLVDEILEYCNDNYHETQDADGNDVTLETVATVNYEEGTFAVMKIVGQEENDGIAVYEVIEKEDGSKEYEMVDDDEIIDMVYNDYLNIKNEYFNEN